MNIQPHDNNSGNQFVNCVSEINFIEMNEKLHFKNHTVWGPDKAYQNIQDMSKYASLDEPNCKILLNPSIKNLAKQFCSWGPFYVFLHL